MTGSAALEPSVTAVRSLPPITTSAIVAPLARHGVDFLLSEPYHLFAIIARVNGRSWHYVQ